MVLINTILLIISYLWILIDYLINREGDRFLEACGLNREWPEGRGIFHNDDKTFLVWVNEEDQLRIISMQQGADLHAVFDRLSRACAHIQKVAKFSHDNHLGYITSCPTNLGTALRASVHIRLPKPQNPNRRFHTLIGEFQNIKFIILFSNSNERRCRKT